MNDLGLTLLWLAVQIAVVLVPALVLHALASRRGPGPGAWVATLSLGLVVALSAAAFVPWIERKTKTLTQGDSPFVTAPDSSAMTEATLVFDGHDLGDDRARPVAGPDPILAGLWRAWARFEHGAAAPAARWRPWGSTLAAVALAGTGAGLLQLLIGLWAIGLCHRRGRAVDDPEMTELLDELRVSMGCRRTVELREVPDLTTPATAGWRRPVLLLPDDWRTWDSFERRAVLAHELAHIIRGDYAAGLVARLAVALNYFHPLVRWMAGRLQLQQELAADALGARFAGGQASYLVALSRLALRQDGRSPCWPARAFLPGRGALIRRIAMLRDQNGTNEFDRPWSGARRLGIAVTLLGLTAGVAALRAPARGDDNATSAPAAAAAQARPPATGTTGMPFAPLYVRDDRVGVIAFRPAAAFRHTGLARIVPLTMISEIVGIDLTDLPKELKVDTSRQGFLKLDRENVEWVSCGIGFGRSKNPKGDDLHSFRFDTLTVRTVAPFDWLAFLRQWRFDFAEVREGGRVYYKVTGLLKEVLGLDPCVYLPDDRTIVFDEEKMIRKLAGGQAPPLPAFLRGPDWERARHGLLAVAINNQDGAFTNCYDVVQPGDAVVLSLFKDVDHWTFSVDDADPMVLRAAAACRNADASSAIARSIESLVKQGRDAVGQPAPGARALETHDRNLRMTKALLANLRVEHTSRSVGLRTDGFGTLADFASILEAEAKYEAKSQNQKGKEKPKDAKR